MAELDLSRYSEVAIFNTKAVVQETSVSAATLRAWERRYGVPDPNRTGSNYRLYSERDIALIRWLRERVEAGLTISQAVELYRRTQQGETIKTTLPSMSNFNVHTNGKVHNHPEAKKRLVEAFMRFDERECDLILNDLFGLYSIEDVLGNVIQPAMIEVGDLWHAGKIGIPVEHFASAYVERKVMALMNVQPVNSDAPLVVTGCAPHEQHELGILLFSLFLRRSGLRVLYLGQNVPLVDLRAALETLRPVMLALSASSIESAEGLIPIGMMIERMPTPSPIFAYGGAAFRDKPELMDEIDGIYLGGTEAQVSARAALQHIRRHQYGQKSAEPMTYFNE